MATLSIDFKISTTFPYKKVPAIPELGLDAVDWHAHSAKKTNTSNNPSGTTPSVKNTRLIIALYEPCLITKKHGFSLEKAHFINAVRGTERKHVKCGLECFLYVLGLVSRDFSLNSASNLVPLDPDLHTILDYTGFIAITCSVNTLQQMITLVKEENARWLNNFQEKKEQNRIRDLSGLDFSQVTYELVVLYPHHFLPNGAVLPVYTTNSEGRLDHKIYMIATDGALREGREPECPILPELPNPNQYRTKKEHYLNPFLVVLNSEMAFRRFIRHKNYKESLCTHYCQLIELTIMLVQEIYQAASLAKEVYKIARDNVLNKDPQLKQYDHKQILDDLKILERPPRDVEMYSSPIQSDTILEDTWFHDMLNNPEHPDTVSVIYDGADEHGVKRQHGGGDFGADWDITITPNNYAKQPGPSSDIVPVIYDADEREVKRQRGSIVTPNEYTNQPGSSSYIVGPVISDVDEHGFKRRGSDTNISWRDRPKPDRASRRANGQPGRR